MRFLFVLFLVLISILPLSATHIVGGELNYRCLGEDLYEVSLSVYRDCYNGIPYFDDPASIGVFDVNNNLLFDIRSNLISDDTLQPFVNNPCLVIPPDACVHVGRYRDTLALPFRTGGYQLVYQRCCRNRTINNIYEPDTTGATYYTYLTEEALLGCNSNPVFKNWPPPYICTNVPIDFDHGAEDVDGDSIVYELCTPFHGAEIDGDFNCTPQPCGPRPQPPFPPPYQEVPWISPTYGINNMLGGPHPLTIDSATGFLTAIPTINGQFVVGVCAKEYRNGKLISITRRDFQYNVGTCGFSVSSAFFAPEILCDNALSVQFNNQSIGSDNYQWDFGVLGTLTDTSSLVNPIFIYPDTGRYTITLIAGEGQQCSDTVTHEIYLQYESIFPDFELQIDNCQDSVHLKFIDNTVDTISTIVDWRWLVNGQTYQQQNPTVVFEQGGDYEIRLFVEAENGCTKLYIDTIYLDFPRLYLEDSLVSCNAEPVQLNQGANPNYNYTWMPAQYLDNPNSPSPYANPPTTMIYQVNVPVNGDGGFCVLKKDVTVFVPDPFDVEAPNDTSYCKSTIQLLATSNSNEPLNYIWSYDPNFTNLIQDPTQVSLGYYNNFWVKAIDSYGCEAIDSFQVIDNSVQLSYSDVFVCYGLTLEDTITITLEDQRNLFPINYQWQPNTSILGPLNLPQIQVTVENSETYYFEASNEFGCYLKDSVMVAVAPEYIYSIEKDNDICDGEEQVYLNSSITPNSILWSSSVLFEDTLNKSNVYQMVINDTVTSIYLQLIDQFGCIKIDSILLEDYSIDAYLEDIYICPNQDSVFIKYNYSDYENISWVIYADTINNQNYFNHQALGPTIYSVTVSSLFCSADATAAIVEQFEEPFLQIQADSLVYEGSQIQIEANYNPNYTYQWSPSAGLSSDNIHNPIASITQPINYTVTVTDSNSCTSEKTISIKLKNFVCEEPYIFIPNAFTPNNDNVNDVLYLRGNQIERMYWAIYNRWGEKIFESTDQNIGWDGTYQGKSLAPDVYGYFLQVECVGGEKYFKKGNVTILR